MTSSGSERSAMKRTWEAQLTYEMLPNPRIDTFMARNKVLLADELRRAADADYG